MPHPVREPSGETKRQRRPPRPSGISPVLFHDADAPESFDGVSILSEVSGDLGLALFQLFRDVFLWATVSRESGRPLFGDGAAQRITALLDAARARGELRDDLETLAGVLPDRTGGKSAVATVAALRVSRWASRNSAGATAVHFAQAAAAASPADASAALEVGRHAAAHHRWTLAEAWLRRAIGLARQSGDHQSYADAWLARCRIHVERGDARARPAAARVLRAARRRGLGLTAARAHHELARLDIAAGRFPSAERHARIAYRMLRRREVGAHDVLHDLAEILVAQEEKRRAGMEILVNILPHRSRPEERFRSLLMLIRAAGKEGDVPVVESAWTDALSIADRQADPAVKARQLLELARSADEAREPKRAGEAARGALAVASCNQDLPAIEEVSAFISRRSERGWWSAAES
jgi:tetratricopeptide (TPR) repeat protein